MRTRRIRLRVGVRTRGIKSTQRKLRYAESNLDKAMTFGVFRGTQVIQSRQKARAPVGKRESIPRSIRVLPARKVGRTFTTSSRTGLPLAFFHEEGTGKHGKYGAPYTLYWRMPDGTRRPGGRPVHGGADYSFEGGRPIKHPGVRPQHFFEQGFDQGADQAVDILYQHIGRSFVR